MKQAILALLSSKKGLTMIVGVLVALAGQLDIGVSEDTIMEIVGLLATFIVGQGIADMGKHQQK